ncbi:hypothetical protein C4588_06180 [Candidatus Parcubacteria bacterium]|nr:MAG: hypothetical protein C4588_06180 [Candidatus Parcubacteria bacterium]
MDLKFYVYEPSSRYTKFQHRTRVDAEKEAERLAIQNPGKSFEILAAVSVVVKNDVVWDRVPVDEIPF